MRPRRWRPAALLVLPALLLLAVSVAWPLALVVFQAFTNATAPAVFPRTAEALAAWDGRALPPDTVAGTFAAELVAADGARSLPRAGSALDHDMEGFRRILVRTARRLDEEAAALTTVADLAAIDENWGRIATWRSLRRGLAPVTTTHLLRVLDFAYDRDGALVRRPETERIYVDAVVRTVWISALVTALCVLLAFPVALVMVYGGPVLRTLALGCVLLPFWTSLLVRTSAWIVLLQRQGLVNDTLLGLGLTAERVQLIHNRTGLVIAMVHILLPFVVLPLYAAMRSVPVQQMRSAVGLGAHPLRAFRDVYLPQVLPGLRTGVILAFVIALGFYVTPALVGGPGDQMISSFIASSVNERLDWATASALSVLLLGLLVTALAGFVLFRPRATRA